MYDYGEHAGAPYLVMEYVPLGTLKHRIALQEGGPMAWQAACHLLLPIAQALEFAHERGIIHRDVKPSNILITQSDQPMLSDFGIVKLLEIKETHTLTGTGFGVGTPEYMAPEQWAGNVLPQSDQYSLGVVLYEMVTGKKPYQADTPAGIMLKQATEPLPPPREFVPDLPVELEEALLKALSPDPENRFPDMSAFADSLYDLPGMASRAHRPKKRPKSRRAAQVKTTRKKTAAGVPRRKSLAALWFVIPSLVILLGAGGFLAWNIFQAGQKIQSALVGWIGMAATSSPSPEVTGTPRLAARPTASFTPLITPIFTAVPTTPPQPASMLLAGMQLPQPKKIISQADIKNLTQLALWGSGPVGQVRWMSDKKYLLAASTNGITLYDADSLSAVRFIPGPAYDSYFSDDGSLMALTQDSRTLELQNVVEGTTIHTFTIPESTGDISAVAFSKSNELLAIGTTYRTITLWNISDGALDKTFSAAGMYVTSLAFSPAGNELAAGSGSEQLGDFALRIWDVEQEKIPPHRIPSHKTPVTRLVYSPDGSLLASGSAEGTIYIWDVINEPFQHGAFPASVNYSKKAVGGMVFSQDGSFFAYSLNNSIYLRQVSDGLLVRLMNDHTNHINSLAFSTDGITLASGADDCSIRFWKIPTGTTTKSFIGSSAEYISAMAFSRDGSTFAAGSGDGTVHIWSVQNGNEMETVSVRAIGDLCSTLVFHPSAKVVACGLTNGRILFIDTNSGGYTGDINLIYEPKHKSAVVYMAYSEDGKQMVSADLNGIVRVWNLPGRSIANTLDVGPANVFTVSPDFTTLAANQYKSLNLWQLKNGELLYRMKGQVNSVISLAYSPDGKTILSGASDNSIQASNDSDGQPQGSQMGSTTPTRLSFSADGSLSASTGDNSVDIWWNADQTILRTISLPQTFIEPAAFPPTVTFSPDGAYLVFGLADGTIQIWGVP